MSNVSFQQLNCAMHMHVNIMHRYMHVNFYQNINKTVMKCFVGTVLIERARAKTLPLKILDFKNVPVLKVSLYKCSILIKQLAHVSPFQRNFHETWWAPLYLNENQCNQQHLRFFAYQASKLYASKPDVENQIIICTNFPNKVGTLKQQDALQIER